MIPQEIKEKIRDTYDYSFAGEIKMEAAEYGYSLAQEEIAAKDKEIERIKKMLEKQVEAITLLMCPTETTEQTLNAVVNRAWQTFKTENNL